MRRKRLERAQSRAEEPASELESTLHMPLEAGTRLGPYEILGAIGAGGMGEVYRARDIRLDRTVAIKVLTGALAAIRNRGSASSRKRARLPR